MRNLRWLLLFALIAFVIWRISPFFSNIKILFSARNFHSTWLLAAILTQTGLYIADGWLSQTLLKILNFKMNLKDTARVAAATVVTARFSPVGETGALITIFYFYQKLGVTPEAIIFLSIAWGIISIFVLLLIFLISLLFIPRVTLPIHLSLSNLLLLTFIILLITFLIINRKTIYRKLKHIFPKSDWFEHLVKFTKNWSNYKHLLWENPYQIIQANIASALYHLTNILTLAFSFLAFGNPPQFSILAFAYAVSLASGWITLSPGGIGTADATLVLIFLHFKVNPAHAAASVLLYRLITTILPIPAGALSYFSLKNKFK